MTRRALMVSVGGALMVFSLALIVTSIRSSTSIVLALAGGLCLAAGATLVGIGLGRWTRSRPAPSDATYTGAGDVKDSAIPPRIV